MNDLSALSRVVRTARRETAPVRRNDERLRPPVRIAECEAKVMLLPGKFRTADHVRRHVDFVLTRDAEQGEQHVRRNLHALRLTMEEMGIDQDVIDAEVRHFEAAVRREIWQRILLP